MIAITEATSRTFRRHQNPIGAVVRQKPIYSAASSSLLATTVHLNHPEAHHQVRNTLSYTLVPSTLADAPSFAVVGQAKPSPSSIRRGKPASAATLPPGVRVIYMARTCLLNQPPSHPRATSPQSKSNHLDESVPPWAESLTCGPHVSVDCSVNPWTVDPCANLVDQVHGPRAHMSATPPFPRIYFNSEIS